MHGLLICSSLDQQQESERAVSISPYRLVPTESRESTFIGSIPVMAAISHEIEDIVIENNLPIDLFAGFQRFSYLAQRKYRYERLARACRRVYVWGVPDIDPPQIHNIEYVPLTQDTDLAREWFLVVDSPQFFTALLAQESPPALDDPGRERRYRCVWSHDPQFVSQARLTTAQLLGLPNQPIIERNYEEQSRYLAQVFARMLKRREQQIIDRALAQHRNTMLQSGLAASETPLLVLDVHKTIIAASPPACDILGMERSQLLGQPLDCCDIFAQRDPTLVEPPLMALLNVGGHELLGANSKPITDPHGGTIGWVLTLHYMSHQRTRVPRPRLPINTGLQGYCMDLHQQLAALQSLVYRPESHQRALLHTQRLVGALSTQIERLALLHDIESQGEIERAAIAIKPLLQTICDEDRATLRRQGILLLLDVPDHLTPTWCSSYQVHLAFKELLDNLTKHAAGCTVARVHAREEHGYLHLSLQDNGCGMDEQQQEAVFAPFARLHHEHQNRGYEVVRLGLPLVRAVARAHHGHLRIESQPGQGSIFTLLLPMLAPQ